MRQLQRGQRAVGGLEAKFPIGDWRGAETSPYLDSTLKCDKDYIWGHAVSQQHPTSMTQPQSEIRLYKQRASYSLLAAAEIFRESPIAHVAFLHPGDGEGRGKRGPTLFNMPMIMVMMCEGDEEDQDDYAVYLHT